MPIFHYKAIDSTGTHSEGDMEALDRTDLTHKLKAEDKIALTVDEKSRGLNMEIKLPFMGGIKAHDKIIFARNLGTMIDAGLPMTRALSILERQSKGDLKKTISAIIENVSKGKTLSESIAEYPKVFSGLFISMVKAGEESGNLVTSLKNVAMQLEKSYLLTKKVKGAMMYPIVIIGLMIVIGTLMLIYVVPTLSSTFSALGAQLPITTQIVIALSNILKDYILFIVPGVILLGFALSWFFRTPRGSHIVDWTLLHTPIIGDITKEVNSARTARTLSSLLSSGVDIVVALSVTEEVVQNSYYKSVIHDAQATIQKGDVISSIFSSHPELYPIFVGEMIAVGEETGKIGDMLLGVAEFYEEDVDQRTKDMSAIIEPFLMIIIGAAVGVFAFSIITPIYSLSSVIK